jgi:UDP-glucuronate 4-epimerase
MDLVNFDSIYNLLKSFQPELVIHLAAQAGVRYSIQNPKAYFESNIIGYFNLLESLRMTGINKIIYASSSSVYGNSSEVPFVETSYTNHPVSFYAATKKCNELFSESYSKVHGIHAIGMRFFTVYGPFGRPDMAYFSFVKDILSERAIKLFNYGNLSRDFTYIDDIVNSVLILSNKIDIITKETNHQIFNIGNSNPVSLISFVNAIEDILGKKAIIENVGMQPGDVYQTFANVEKLKEITGLVPETTLVHGLTKYVSWYKSYYL